MKTKLMLSYGMNTNLDHMSVRCPTAVSLGSAILPGFEFVFNHHATIIPNIDKEVIGVLWEITPTDEEMLDLIEGYPTYYDKQTVEVIYQGEVHTAMTYLMHPPNDLAMPTDHYFELILQGYMQHGISLTQAINARARASEVEFGYN